MTVSSEPGPTIVAENPVPTAARVGPFWTRIAYAGEFLLALIAVYAVWSQVGGQGHLDMMPWYGKLAAGLGAAVSIVGATASAAVREKWLNARSVAWVVLLLILTGVMAALTYYYHLQEGDEPGDSSQGVAAVAVAGGGPSA